MVKAIEVTQVRNKPYATIEITDLSNVVVFDNLVYIEITECEHQYGAQNLC